MPRARQGVLHCQTANRHASSRMNHTFRALAERDFRLYFFGQALSLVGTWVQQVAMSWIVYRVTGSAFMLGLIAFSGQIPILLLAPVGGLLADRLNRRKLLAAIQVVAMAVAMFLGYLSYTESFSAWALISAAVVLGTSSAIEMPTRQAFILQTIHDRSHATNAIALNSLAFNGARVVGPAVAGAVLALIGETACFVVNAISYLAAIYTLLVMRPRAMDPHRRKGSMREAIQYVQSFPPARWLLATVAAASICLAPMMTFMPVYAKDIFHGGPDTLGMLMGASGMGAVIAGVYLANRTTIIGLDARIGVSCLVVGAALLAFSYNPLFLGGAAGSSCVGDKYYPRRHCEQHDFAAFGAGASARARNGALYDVLLRYAAPECFGRRRPRARGRGATGFRCGRARRNRFWPDIQAATTAPARVSSPSDGREGAALAVERASVNFEALAMHCMSCGVTHGKKTPR